MTPASTPLRFLVVDDDEDMREVLVRVVERMGHAVDQASDGAKAVEALARRSYDVMLLDLSMPRMTGEDVLRWLRRHPQSAAGVRVIVVSAWAESRVNALTALGVDAVLPKPLLAEQLRELLEGRARSESA
ncbi:response regulator [Nocardioides sp.]|uniref:response regulator n=1 Tax=Nocardioides sp. TaxID=35761 RepID=UPI002CD3DF0A|nr:response regulator [Nocardioides sp.]HXH81098.1 response regulator [Nocardioides sp.]